MANDNPNLKKNGGEGTKVGNFLRGVVNVAPELLELAGAVTGIDGLKILGKKISGDNSLSKIDKEIALQMLALDIAEAQEVTKRWQSDMTSDSWLSKNVRPLVLLFLTLCMATFIIIDSSNDGFTVKEDWISLLSSLLLLVYGAYFGGRSLEKIQKMRK